MMRLRAIFIFPALIALMALAGCGSSKSASGPGKTSTSLNAAGRKDVDQLASAQVFVDATRARILEDYQTATELYKQVLKMDPYNDAAPYELGLIFFNAGQNDLARQYVNLALQNDSLNSVFDEVQVALKKDSTQSPKTLTAKAQASYKPNKWYVVLQADIYTSLANYEAAIKSYQKLLTHYPTEYDYYFDWAFALIKSNKLPEALKIYDKLEDLIGLDENVIAQKQRIYLQLGQVDKAALEIQRLINEYPEEPGYYQMLAELYQAAERTEDVIKVYENLLKVSPSNPYALLNLAEIYRLKSDRPKYMQYLKEAFHNPELGVDSKIRVLYPYLQTFGKDTARNEEAFALSQILIETHPDEAKSHAIYGDLLYQDDQMDEALTQYKLALEIDSSEFAVWQQVFFILSDQQKYADLAKMTEGALELFPNQPIVYFFNGISYNQLKQYQKAVETLNAGKGLVVDNTTLKVQFFSSLGDAYNSLENYAASDSAFDWALTYDRNNSYVLNNYSYYLSLRRENLQKAKEMSLRSNDLEPNNGSFQDTYAWILFQLGEYQDAKKWIERALSNGEENSSVILEHYGDILFQLGEKDKALEQWEKAMKLGTDSKTLAKKIADRKFYE